jgi:hypothetical protein
MAFSAGTALAPSSKLAAAEWASCDVHLPGLGVIDDDACYRAMDWLIEVKDELEREVFDQVANLLNLEVDLLFFDTTSTYFDIDEADESVWRDERGMPTQQADAGDEDRHGGGSVAMATPRTTAMICRRCWSA